VKFCEVLQCGAHLMLGRFLDRLAAGYEVQVLELTDSMHLYAFLYQTCGFKPFDRSETPFGSLLF